jgi:bifunctional non-homologous end joining protein LigD
MLAALARDLPAGERWSYEVKWDGYRTLAAKENGRVTLYSRNLKNATAQYPAIAAGIQAIRAASLLLDGEIVALDAQGRPSFQALHHQDVHALAYYVFDLLHLNGRDFVGESLHVRRAALDAIRLTSPILRSEPLPGTPKQIERAVRRLALEGVVAKRIDSHYEAGRRSGAWVKVKFEQRQELVIGGFREANRIVDALIVGYYSGKQLLSAGKVRAGMTPRIRSELYAQLNALRTIDCPFANLPDLKGSHWGEGITSEEMRELTWIKPLIVADVAFTEWTRDSHLRHARFLGLRTDKEPREVEREDNV